MLNAVKYLNLMNKRDEIYKAKMTLKKHVDKTHISSKAFWNGQVNGKSLHSIRKLAVDCEMII